MRMSTAPAERGVDGAVNGAKGRLSSGVGDGGAGMLGNSAKS